VHEGEKQAVQDIFLRALCGFVVQIQDEFKTCKRNHRRAAILLVAQDNEEGMRFAVPKKSLRSLPLKMA